MRKSLTKRKSRSTDALENTSSDDDLDSLKTIRKDKNHRGRKNRNHKAW
ncbi:uncharacterized protein G2W53_014522 [Senna tora]|uniref:Uncharacterized protein n=1 Tax=Senna tora TaxID=362788 RepID=A0A834WTV6_9FABA|nr:uncharacterized protein G2W53_014522 [Senna tora]